MKSVECSERFGFSRRSARPAVHSLSPMCRGKTTSAVDTAEVSSRAVEPPRILLAVHTFPHSYLHLLAHLANAGFEVDLLACRGNPLLASRSVKRRWPVARDGAAFAARIRERLATGEYAALQLVDEPALLAALAAGSEMLPSPYLPFTDPQLYSGVGRKASFHAWCTHHGIPTPSSAILRSWEDVRSAATPFDCPYIVKGDTGSGGQTVRLIRSQAELDAARPALAGHGPWLVQERVSSPTYGALFAAHQGRLLGWFAIIKRVVLGDGRGPTLIGEICSPDGLEDICNRLCALGGLNGLHGFDFMLSPEGRPLVIDPHLGRCTTMTHFGTLCGVNLGALWRDALLGSPRPVARPDSTGAVFLKFPEVIQYIFEGGLRQTLADLHPWKSRLTVGWGTPSEFPAIALGSANIFIGSVRVALGAIRRRWCN
jgi:hypothetical protein